MADNLYFVGSDPFITDVADDGSGIDTMQADSVHDTYGFIDLAYEGDDTVAYGRAPTRAGIDSGWTRVTNGPIENAIGDPDAPNYLYGNVVANVLTGGGLTDTLDGRAGNDTLYGRGGADVLYGGADQDVLYGEAGSDFLDGGLGNDQLFGGDNDDTIVYDAADTFSNVTGGAGYDTLLIKTSGAAPTHLALAAQGFEQANVEYTDVGGAPWTTITLYYTGSWQLFARTTVNDNATRVTNVFDYDSSKPWSSYDQNYNSGGQLVWSRTFADGGSYETQYYDTTGQPWSSYIDYSSAAGVLQSRRTIFDNGRFETQYFDTAGQPWSSYIDYSNGSGQIEARRSILDNGRTETTYFDTASANSWSSYADFATSAGVVDARRTIYDDASYSSTYFDVGGVNPWAQYTDWFNAAGGFRFRSGVYDDGMVF